MFETFSTTLPITDFFPASAGWVACPDGTPQGSIATDAAGVWTFTPTPPTISPAQQAAVNYAAFIAAGLTIASTSTPAIDGVYAIGATDQADISTEAQFIATFSEFTNGSTTNLLWLLLDGVTQVTFPTTAEFLAFAKAVGQKVAAAKLALIQLAAMPSPIAAIT